MKIKNLLFTASAITLFGTAALTVNAKADSNNDTVQVPQVKPADLK